MLIQIVGLILIENLFRITAKFYTRPREQQAIPTYLVAASGVNLCALKFRSRPWKEKHWS
jgi:hypothetical protein